MFYGGGKEIRERSLRFVVDIIKITYGLPQNSVAFELTKQIVRSSGSIGANLSEASQARTKKEFISCANISLKEAEETNWWLNVLHKSDLINKEVFERLSKECIEIIKILITIVKNAKS